MTNRRTGRPNLRVVGGTDTSPPDRSTPSERSPAQDRAPAPDQAPPSDQARSPDRDPEEDLLPPEELLAQMFEALADGIADEPFPLGPELHVSGLLGDLSEMISRAGVIPLPDPDRTADEPTPIDFLLLQLTLYAESLASPDALAVLRALTPFTEGAVRAAITSAADRLAAGGVTEPPWASTIGKPTVERCWRHGDVMGFQESYHVVFADGPRRHALAVLIDHQLGGGIKDAWVSDDPDRLWAQVRRAATSDPAILLEEVTWSVARAALREALSHDTCAADPDQVEDTTHHLLLVGSRVTLDDGAARAGAPARPPARRRRPREILQLKVTLKGSKPPIWRRLEVPAAITLEQLDQVIQAAFEWGGWHLHSFETSKGEYGVPDPEWDLPVRNERGVRLTNVAGVGEKLTYTYDFGDNWEHQVLVEKSAPGESGVTYPRCTGGRRAAPPDDCGGIWGYYELLDVIANPVHEEHEDSVTWLASMWGMEPEDLEHFDPASFRPGDVNEALADLAR